MHDRFILLKREHELTVQERFLLENWTSLHPDLGEAYRLKEQFFAIYDAANKGEAQRHYIAWESSIPSLAKAAFQPITTAWRNWHRQILAYFDYPITNAYTESLNNLIRVMNRLGRGYSFEALRAKILFTEGLHKHLNKRPKWSRTSRRRETHMSAMMSYDAPMFGQDAFEEDETLNVGVDIAALAHRIETGRF